MTFWDWRKQFNVYLQAWSPQLCSECLYSLFFGGVSAQKALRVPGYWSNAFRTLKYPTCLATSWYPRLNVGNPSMPVLEIANFARPGFNRPRLRSHDTLRSPMWDEVNDIWYLKLLEFLCTYGLMDVCCFQKDSCCIFSKPIRILGRQQDTYS